MKVLFICKGNWFRSQIAAAIYNKLTNTENAKSVGTYVGAPDEPEGMLISDVMTHHFFEVMERNGMNIRDHRSKCLLPEMPNQYDIVVSMAEEPYIPDFLKSDPKVIWWDVKDGQGVEKTYEQIFTLVKDLISNLELTSQQKIDISLNN